MTKLLKTVEEHNKNKYLSLEHKVTPSGVECPKCKTEMNYKDNNVLLSYPPLYRIICPSCGYGTTIL